MVKRKCGTCRHFKDGGIAGSGWCQHPARKDIQHMVLVRKTELACRNSWDQDLWELADRPIDIQNSTHIPMPQTGGEPQDVPIIHAELSADDAERAGEMFTDRITSISMPTRSQLRPGAFSPDPELDASSDSDSLGARSSVREARKRRQEQRHLERKKHQESVLQRADDLLDTSNPVNEADRGMTRVRASDGPLTANHDELPNPPHEREQPPTRPAAPERLEPRPAPVPAIEFSATPPRFGRGISPLPPTSPAEPIAKAPPKSSNGNHVNTGTSALERGETEQMPSVEEVREAVIKQREQRGGEAKAPNRRPPSARKSQVSDVNPSTRSEPPVVLPPAVDERPPIRITGAGRINKPAGPNHAPAPYAVDPIDVARDLQTVRRCCATCRDFKQVGDGRSGWCNNPYAFSEKRMVQSDEIACRSSLGVWWLPNDDLWLEYADTTHHGRPTPLLDDMVIAHPAERHGMGQRSSS